MANCWYLYNGVGNPLAATSYSLAAFVPDCLDGCCLCAIFAPNCNAVPASPFSAALVAAINNAIATCLHQAVGGVTVVAMKAC